MRLCHISLVHMSHNACCNVANLMYLCIHTGQIVHLLLFEEFAH